MQKSISRFKIFLLFSNDKFHVKMKTHNIQVHMLVNGIGFLHVCPLCLEPPHHSHFHMLVDLSVLDLLYWVGCRPDVLCIFGDETWME